jgi:hypothetical protein
MDLVKPTVGICSSGIEGNLFCIFMTFIKFPMNFRTLNEFPGILNQKRFQKWKTIEQGLGLIRPMVSQHRPGPKAKMAWPARDPSTAQAHAGSHHA